MVGGEGQGMERELGIEPRVLEEAISQGGGVNAKFHRPAARLADQR